MTVEITLTLADADATTFDLYSNVDSFGIPFETGVPVASLTAGYTTALVPDGTTVIRVQNVSASCSNFIDLVLTTTTTTTVSTTTSTTTVASIACDATTNAGGAGVTEYTLDLEPTGSCIIMDFNAQGVPDKLEILHNGVRVATSGMTAANSGPFDTLYGDPTVPTSGQAAATDQFIGTSKGAINNRNAEFLADTGIAGITANRQQLIWFLYDSADYAVNPQVTIRITGPTGTAWNLDRQCPPELELVDVIFNSGDSPSDIWQFKPSTFDEVFLFSVTDPSPDVAHTENKLWVYNGTAIELEEYDITLTPFTYVFNRVITNVFTNSGLCAIDDTMLAGRSIAGDYIYTTGGKLIVTTVATGPVYHISQYDYATGTLEFDLDITSTVSNPYGLYQYNSEVFIASSNGDIYNILTAAPYTLTLVHTTAFTINGASQIPSQITEEFTSNTTTTTTTAAPTTTTTTTTTWNIPIANIVSYWNVDSDSVDQVGANDGVDTSISYVASGGIGNVADFTAGVTSQISVADAANLSFISVPFSITFRVKWNSAPVTTIFICKKNIVDGNDAEYQVDWDGINLQFFCFDDTAVNQIKVTVPFAPSVGVWYAIAVTSNGSDLNTGMEIYIDGSIGTPTRSTTGTYVSMEDEPSPIIIGKNSFTTARSLDGYMDEIAIFDKELTASEVSDIYAKNQAGFYLTE